MASDAWRLQLSVVVTAAVVAVLAAPVPAGALFGTASVFTATANARLLQVTLTAQPPIGVDPLLDPGTSTAQAQVDSLGVSQAFASSAYPGQSVLTAGGSLATVTDPQPCYFVLRGDRTGKGFVTPRGAGAICT